MRNNNTAEPIKIGYLELLISLPVFVAFQENIFQKYGLNVELVLYSSADDMIKSLTQGDIDFCGYCAVPIAFLSMAKDDDKKLVFIGGVFEDNDHQISLILINKKSEIKSFQDLSDKKIGYFNTEAYRCWLEKILNKLNIQFDVEKHQFLKSGEHLKKQIEEENFDAIFVNSSIISEWILDKYKLQDFDKDAIVPNVYNDDPEIKSPSFYFGSFYTTFKYYNHNPIAVRKISLALDKSIIKISQDYDRYFVDKAINRFLKGQKQISELFLPFFRKTNEVKDGNLMELRRLYTYENVLKEKIDVKKLQLQYYPFSTTVTLILEKFKDIFLKQYTFIYKNAAVLALIVSVLISNRDLKRSMAEENRQLDIFQKTTPAQFSLFVSPYESAKLTNTGISSMKDITFDWSFYFVFDNDNILLADKLSDIVKSDTTMLNLFRGKNLISNADGFDGLFELNKEYFVKDIPAYRRITDEIESIYRSPEVYIDNSTNAILNILRTSKALGAEIVMRWRIQYHEELTNKKNISYYYMWFNTDEYTIEDLEFVLGGNRIINLIKNYEDTTKDIIYK